MKKLLCLFIALALNVAFSYGQALLEPTTPVRPQIPLQEYPWLQINCHNPANDQKLHPKWTVIVTSVKPSIKQIDTNRWEISFTGTN